MGHDISLIAKDSDPFSAYLAIPPSGTGPGLVVIQEVFGVNAVMRGIADGFATQGYFALCPDLFWRQEPGIQLSDQTETERQKAFQLYQGFDADRGIDDITVTIDYLRQYDGCSGKVGAVGYCLGGFLAYLTAARTDVDASVGYYGVSIETRLDEAENVTKPLLLHVATDDEFCPPEAQSRLHEGLDTHPLVTIHDYPGMHHAFARVGGAHFDASAADIANARSLDLFETALI